ncbi:XdhC family protein [Flavimarina sp. Hel_I_48]|uniref:XdhC family protein n=1 Tax=Flavimarina sp. Hel_I_48 TaxID=1392488 RepID=UPI0004DF4A72|nr:XdhC/CoxI family protein [Flavimarina sp. Hel_I_48]
MTHEFIAIVAQARRDQENGIQSVLATVVALDGSSYRKPGVRMLLSENGLMTGAVSGGCVEKEVQHRAATVFKDQKPKVITYDGRYRLGCEGILYILLEPFTLSTEYVTQFYNAINQRRPFYISSFYRKEDEAYGNFGSVFYTEHGEKMPFSTNFSPDGSNSQFEQTMQPLFKLLIIGGEHDAVKLCNSAALLGWQVDIITSVNDPKTEMNFPGAATVSSATPETLVMETLDEQTAVVLMTHNYAQDLKFLLRLQSVDVAYLGLLGSSKRRDQLQNDLLEHAPELALEYLEKIYSPAGLNLGAITPEEIALSILSEIVSVTRDKTPYSLRETIGQIHS